MSTVTRRYAVLSLQDLKDRRSIVLTVENPTKISNEYQPIQLAYDHGYHLFFASRDWLNTDKVKLAKHYGSPEYVRTPEGRTSSWVFLNDLKSGKILDDATTDSYWKKEV